MPDVGGLPRGFWVLFVGTLVNRAGGFALLFLAIYLTDHRGFSAAQAGGVVSAYGGGAILGGPVGGTLADRIGRRPTLVGCLFAGGLSVLALGFATTPALITLVAVLAGAFYEMYRPVVSAAIADIVPPDDRMRAFALQYWAVNLGASIAFVAGGVLAARSFALLFTFDAMTTVGFAAIVWAALPETRPQGETAQQSHVPLGAVLSDRIFVAVCGLAALFSLVFFQSFVALPIDMRAHRLGADVIGLVMATNGVLIVLLQPYAASAIANWRRPSVLGAAALFLGAGFGMNAWVGSPSGYVLAIAVWTLGEILFAPASTSLVADLAPATLRGRYQGVLAAAFTSAFAAAPLAGGFVVAHAGAGWLWIGCALVGLVTALGFLALRHVA